MKLPTMPITKTYTSLFLGILGKALIPIGVNTREAIKIRKQPTSKALKMRSPFFIKMKELPQMEEIRNNKTHASDDFGF